MGKVDSNLVGPSRAETQPHQCVALQPFRHLIMRNSRLPCFADPAAGGMEPVLADRSINGAFMLGYASFR
ncbi:hypothetical protein D3C75_751140 [compost metagenome]